MKLDTRPSWDDTWMAVAQTVAKRGTCDRKQVGCVYVSHDNQLLASGYNGSMPGLPHCDEVGHDMMNGSCQRTIHAEMNGLIQAAARGISLRGSTLYTTTHPCWNCFKHLGGLVTAIVFLDEYLTQPPTRVQVAAMDLPDFKGLRRYTPPQEPNP